MTVPASSEEDSFLKVHLTDVDWVLEFENALADAHILERPLSKSAIVRAGKQAVDLFDSLEMVDLVCVAEKRYLRR